MPPSRPHRSRASIGSNDGLATALNNDGATPLLARYHSGLGGHTWRYPLQPQPSIIIPIMCPVPVPINQWEEAQNAALRSTASSLRSSGGPSNAWPLLPPALALPPTGAGLFESLPEVVVNALQQAAARSTTTPPQPPTPDVAASNASVSSEVRQVADGEEEEGPKNKYSEVWDTMFAKLVMYRAKHGDCLVPSHYKLDPKLGRWVMNQRHKKDLLSPIRKHRLNELGFVWCVKQQETWDAMFERLVKYKMEHGDCLVPQKFKDDPRLGEWVQTQRRDKKRRRNLSPDRQARLEAIGFEWCPHQYIWDVMYERLLKFKSKYGNCLVPRHWDEDQKLGRWVDQQRVKNKKGNLPPDRKQQLSDVGFIWKMR